MVRKKGQEEMVGLVMVILLVAVIFIVFLGIMVRRGGASETQSLEVYQFLDSLSEFTSNCSSDSGYSYKQIDDLAVSCDRGLTCSGEGNACDYLNSSVKNIIEANWNFGESSPQKGYNFVAKFSSREPMKISSESGNCGVVRGAEKQFLNMNFTLEICLD